MNILKKIIAFTWFPVSVFLVAISVVLFPGIFLFLPFIFVFVVLGFIGKYIFEEYYD